MLLLPQRLYILELAKTNLKKVVVSYSCKEAIAHEQTYMSRLVTGPPAKENEGTKFNKVEGQFWCPSQLEGLICSQP